MYHPFSITETLNIAWHVLKKNFATIAVYTLVAIVIFGITGFIVNYMLIDDLLTYIGLTVTLILFSFIFLGFIKLIFQLIDKEYYDFEFKDILPNVKMLFSYIILLIIVSTIAVFSNKLIQNIENLFIHKILNFFIDVFMEIFFLFYFPICACFIVDEGSGPFESFEKSFRLIKSDFLKYFLLFLIIETLVFIGLKTVIGIIFVVPFVNIVLVVAYRKLVYSHLDMDDDITETV